MTDPPAPHGRIRDVMAGAELDAEILRLRTAGWTLQAIADHVGFAAASTVMRRIEAAYIRTVREPADIARRLDLDRYDLALAKTVEIMNAEHPLVSGGRIVRRRLTDESGLPIVLGRDAEGRPVYAEQDVCDPMPVLAAIGHLVRILAKRCEITGTSAPPRHAVITIDQVDAEIAALSRRLEEIPPGIEPGASDA